MATDDRPDDPLVVERRQGRSGELVLRRGPGGWEVILNGAFLIASVNEASSRALIRAALPSLPARPLAVLIGGLGMGYALDEALKLGSLESVTVAEYEPVIVEWFERYFGGRGARLRRAPRPPGDSDPPPASDPSPESGSLRDEGPSPEAVPRLLVADVGEVLRDAPAAFDLVVLDTDNGPAWLVRDGNAALYEPAGIELAAAALRPDGVAVFWSPEPYTWFRRRLRATFADVTASMTHDRVQGRLLSSTMYVCRQPARP